MRAKYFMRQGNIWKFCPFRMKKRPPVLCREVFFLVLLFFADLSGFIGFQFVVTDFQMVEVFFRFSHYDAGET